MTDACEVRVACGSEGEALAVCGAVLEERLAACGQVLGPVTSRYWWEGRLEQATEWLCLLKTRTALLDDVVATVRSAHSYGTPEILAVPVVGGDPSYLEWLRTETGG